MNYKLIDMPFKAEYFEEKGVEAIFELYDYIKGEDNKEMKIKASNILLNNDNVQECVNSFLRSAADDETLQKQLPMIWISYGPSGDEKVPYGKIRLEEGYLLPDES